MRVVGVIGDVARTRDCLRGCLFKGLPASVGIQERGDGGCGGLGLGGRHGCCWEFDVMSWRLWSG